MGTKHIDKYCFLSPEERREAIGLITKFKFKHDELTYRHQHDFRALLVALDDEIKSTLLKYNVPAKLLNETWNGYIGWSYVYRPLLVMFLVETGKLIKPHIIKFKKSVKVLPTGMTVKVTKTPKTPKPE